MNTKTISLLTGIIGTSFTKGSSFRPMEKEMQTMKIFLNSFGEILVKTGIDFSDNEVFQLLDAYKDYLEYETLIRPQEIRGYVKAIEQCLKKFQINIRFYLGKYNAEGSDEISNLLSKISKEGFGCMVWECFFNNETALEISTFLPIFSKYLVQNEEKEFSESFFDKILEILDVGGNKILQKKAFERFYNETWSLFLEKQKFITKSQKKPEEIPEEEKILKNARRLVLNCQKNLLTENFEFISQIIISPYEFTYKNTNDEVISNEKNLIKWPLIFGNDKIEENIDIPLNKLMETGNSKQFHLNYNITNGYLITDLDKTHATRFCVKQTPFLLTNYRIISVGKYQFIVEILVKEKLNQNILILNSENPECSSISDNKSFITNKDKLYILSFGTDKDNEIIMYDQNLPKHCCQIFYDPDKNNWFIVGKHPNSKQKGSFKETFIFLKSSSEYACHSIGTRGYNLEEGMEIEFNKNIFTVFYIFNFLFYGSFRLSTKWRKQ